MIKVCTLASSSSGNSTYIETSNYKILIDIGRTKKYIVEKLNSIGVDYKQIDYVFLTHTHDDHTKSLHTFFKGIKATLVITTKMLMELNDISDIENIIVYEDNPMIEGLDIKTFVMSHDVADIRSFLINDGSSSLVYITDTGYINSKYFKEMKGKSAYYIESNHDIEMLRHGPYPRWLQERVLSDVGHLSNKFTGIYLSKLVSENTKDIILLHLSEKNNDENVALKTVKSYIDDKNIHIECATKDDIGNLIEI